MSETSFKTLHLIPELERAIDEMGFAHATDIQAQTIPLIHEGLDVIGRSQTGTGKTLAFGLPALEAIDTSLREGIVQVLILCPTRELAQQACAEMRRLCRYMPGIHPVDVYGGAPMGAQIMGLKRANIVIGTPGRVMDHMRRGTLKLGALKMIVLDEADEMLSMGFKEDIETILTDTPDTRQTILFSATMPPEILALTRSFQRDPALIEINKAQVTLENIAQFYVDVPMGRKVDALQLLLRYYAPVRAMIFCNTKHMADEVTSTLSARGFAVEGLHGDMKQQQRTGVMNAFKQGKVQLLVCTDVAARGIDVNDIDYVINFDLPQSTEYYVHRIGRTGRAGKTGTALTILSGRRQVFQMRDTARAVRATIVQKAMPTIEEIRQQDAERNVACLEQALAQEVDAATVGMVETLRQRGYSTEQIAEAALRLHFAASYDALCAVPDNPRSAPRAGQTQRAGQASYAPQSGMRTLSINIGRDQRVAPNHIVAAISERCGIAGREIGKIDIYDARTLVSVPEKLAARIVAAMRGCRICGMETTTTLMGRQERVAPPARRHAPYAERMRDGRRAGTPKRKGYNPRGYKG
nr:DEAD/DEAH box helicase [Maliibacterium massiliense]